MAGSIAFTCLCYLIYVFAVLHSSDGQSGFLEPPDEPNTGGGNNNNNNNKGGGGNQKKNNNKQSNDANCMPGRKVSQFDSSGFEAKEGGPIVQPSELSCNIPGNPDNVPQECGCWRNLPFGSPATRNLIHIRGDASDCFNGGRNRGYLGSISPDVPDEPDDLAIFESCAVLCTGSDVTVKPRFWRSASNIDVIVCKKSPWDNTSPPTDCVPVNGKEDVTLPGGEIFAIVLVARLKKANENAPVFLLESIETEFAPCEPTTLAPTTTTTAPQPNLCEKAACNFLDGACLWQQNNPGNRWSRYQANEIAGNEDTGVNAWMLQRKFNYPQVSNRPYQGVRLNPGEKAVMEIFDLEPGLEPVTMVARVYESTDQAFIAVCQNTDCQPVTNIGVTISDREWKEISVPLNPETKRLAIVGDNSGGPFFSSAGIMDVNFLDAAGQPLCQYI